MSKLFAIRTLSAVLVAASALTLAANASAQTSDEPTSVTVSYADLDLGHAAGARVLLQRIRSASTRACGGQPDLREVQQVTDFVKCREKATRAAIAEVDSPILTAVASRQDV